MPLNIDLRDLDELKSHIAETLESTLDKKLDPLLKRVEGVEEKLKEITPIRNDVADLKKNQGRALVGWTILVMGVTVLAEQGKEWIVKHLR